MVLLGPPQKRGERTACRARRIYAGADFGKRGSMPNHANDAVPGAAGAFESLSARLADPRVVLLAVGLLGLALDLFVRPISWVGLSLIVLATAPWILQAWSQRSAPGRRPAASPQVPHNGAVRGKVAAEQAGGPGGHVQRATRPQPAAHEPVRRAPAAEPVTGRATVAAPAVAPDRGPTPARPPHARPDPARTA